MLRCTTTFHEQSESTWNLQCSSSHANSNDVKGFLQSAHLNTVSSPVCLRGVQGTAEEEPSVKHLRHEHSEAEPAYAFRHGSARTLQDGTGLNVSLNKLVVISICLQHAKSASVTACFGNLQQRTCSAQKVQCFSQQKVCSYDELCHNVMHRKCLTYQLVHCGMLCHATLLCCACAVLLMSSYCADCCHLSR